jgi:hypothetical protein
MEPMETVNLDTIETNLEATASAQAGSVLAGPGAKVVHPDIAEWPGRNVVDRGSERIGTLEDVSVEVQPDERRFGPVREGFRDRYPRLVPLVMVTTGPLNVQVSVSRPRVKDALSVRLEGDARSQADESALSHHDQLNQARSDTPSGRRLARR